MIGLLFCPSPKFLKGFEKKTLLFLLYLACFYY